MQCNQALEPAEICHVQGEYEIDSVNMHHRRQTCVINLDPRDATLCKPARHPASDSCPIQWRAPRARLLRSSSLDHFAQLGAPWHSTTQRYSGGCSEESRVGWRGEPGLCPLLCAADPRVVLFEAGCSYRRDTKQSSFNHVPDKSTRGRSFREGEGQVQPES